MLIFLWFSTPRYIKQTVWAQLNIVFKLPFYLVPQDRWRVRNPILTPTLSNCTYAFDKKKIVYMWLVLWKHDQIIKNSFFFASPTFGSGRFSQNQNLPRTIQLFVKILKSCSCRIQFFKNLNKVEKLVYSNFQKLATNQLHLVILNSLKRHLGLGREGFFKFAPIRIVSGYCFHYTTYEIDKILSLHNIWGVSISPRDWQVADLKTNDWKRPSLVPYIQFKWRGKMRIWHMRYVHSKRTGSTE